MIRRVLLLAMVMASSAFGEETVRIVIGESPEVRLEGSSISAGNDTEEAVLAPLGKEAVSVRAQDAGFSINGVFQSGESVRFRAAGAITVNKQSMRGDVVIRRIARSLQLINVISLEDYLVGVIGSEMPKSFPNEALKAQAIAARTYALHKKLEMYGQPYHLGSSVLSQVYSGLRNEDPRTREAVEATSGQVLTHELVPIEAYFHSSCGGHTETGLDALNRNLPYLTSVSCPCGKLAVSKWKLHLDASEVQRAVGASDDVAIAARSPSGRARKIRLSSARTVEAVSFRERLGYGRVKSLDFEIRHDGRGYELTGKGFGHGAGLCQWGAKMLAEQGWDFQRILAHYYPGTELQTLY